MGTESCHDMAGRHIGRSLLLYSHLASSSEVGYIGWWSTFQTGPVMSSIV